MKQAVVAVINRRDRFLLIRRGPSVAFTGYWTPPSGSVESGESQAAALVREMREELSVEVRPVEAVWACPSHDQRYRLHWWLAEIVDGEPQPDGEEVAEARWVTFREMQALEPTFEDDLWFFGQVWPTLEID